MLVVGRHVSHFWRSFRGNPRLRQTITRSSFGGMAYNIADLFEHAVDYFPDRLAVACGDDEVTYAELEEQANRLAHHLADHGVTAGSHVGMCTRNRLQSI